MKMLRLLLAIGCLSFMSPAMADDDSSTSIDNSNAYYFAQQLQYATRSLYQAVSYQPRGRVGQDVYNLVIQSDSIAQQVQYDPYGQSARYQLSTFDSQFSRVRAAIQYDPTLSRDYRVASAVNQIASSSAQLRNALQGSWPQPNPNPWPQPNPNPWPQPNLVVCYAASANGSTYVGQGFSYNEAYSNALRACSQNRDRCTVTGCR